MAETSKNSFKRGFKKTKIISGKRIITPKLNQLDKNYSQFLPHQLHNSKEIQLFKKYFIKVGYSKLGRQIKE